MTGRLIAVEGVDASGKSTQAQLLADSLGAMLTFQFGATGVGEVIRGVLLDPANDSVDDRTEALLIIADKAQHVAEIVAPALESGRDVVTDRFTASTLAYQGYGRGLDLGELEAMMRFATGGLEPDLTLLLDLPLEQAWQRLGSSVDRFEGQGRAVPRPGPSRLSGHGRGRSGPLGGSGRRGHHRRDRGPDPGRGA